MPCRAAALKLSLVVACTVVAVAIDAEIDSREYFHHLDQDADDALTVDEVTPELLRKLHYSGKAQSLFSEMDVSKDSTVTYEEYLAFVEPQAEVVHATKDFNNADADEDGFLSMKEYEKSGHATAVPVPKGVRPEMHKSERYHNLDTDNDGRVSELEYTQAQGSDSFSEMDSSRDGKIDAEEWKAYWSSQSKNIQNTKVHDPETFALLDMDHSGGVTRGEYRHLHDLYKEVAFDEQFDELGDADIKHEL